MPHSINASASSQGPLASISILTVEFLYDLLFLSSFDNRVTSLVFNFDFL